MAGPPESVSAANALRWTRWESNPRMNTCPRNRLRHERYYIPFRGKLGAGVCELLPHSPAWICSSAEASKLAGLTRITHGLSASMCPIGLTPTTAKCSAEMRSSTLYAGLLTPFSDLAIKRLVPRPYGQGSHGITRTVLTKLGYGLCEPSANFVPVASRLPIRHGWMGPCPFRLTVVVAPSPHRLRD